MKKNNSTIPPYFKVVTSKGEASGTAEMYLYGYIGQDYWWDEDRQEESLTDLAVVRAIRELEQTHQRINIRINSPGGSVFHGDPIITAIRNCTAEVHGYIDGMAASMAADIWAACPHRHMSINSKLMIHATSSWGQGTAADMRAMADMLDKFDAVAIANFAITTGMDEEDVRANFYDYKDHWVTAREAVEMKLIPEIENYTTQPVADDVTRLTYMELVRQYGARKDEEHRGLVRSIADVIKQWVSPSAKPDFFNQTTSDMTKEDFQKSLGEELPIGDVVAALTAKGYTVTAPAAEKPLEEDGADDIEKAMADAVAAATAPLLATVADLAAQVKALGDMPGAAPTTAPAGADPADGIETSAPDAIRALADAANRGDRVRVG